ncbi:glutathione S-transferase family protein [Neosynechococcus sphagnicola]|uniref:glutathione S-transferase family protein n=1 Tax=Neosynechococcus sphagnicola TaxID=1501145 RepID=UPI001EF9DB7C|nr:glutathione S-transferase family protein [Neosynechococcus sphagnicola]
MVKSTFLFFTQHKFTQVKLYGGARSRASIVQWYLEELAVPYEFVLLDMQAGAHLQPEFLAINPFGKVPAIVDEDLQLWESGAILLYLAQKYGQLTPLPLAIAAQWILFANATLVSGIFVESNRERELPRLMSPLNHLLEQHPFLLEDGFSVADVAVGSVLAYIPIMLKLDLSEYPAIVSYIERLSERPAFQRSIGGRS